MVASGIPLYAGPKRRSNEELSVGCAATVCAYAHASDDSNDAVEKRPALKKYGDTRPDLSVKEPKVRILASRIV